MHFGFAYLGSIGLYIRIVNADTQSTRIANADGQIMRMDMVLFRLD